MSKIFEKEYEVHYYEVNSRLESTITSIINYFSDIGTKQSEELGVGIKYMLEKEFTWVFYKYDIKVNKMPKYGEVLKIKTKPAGFKKFYALRKYEILNNDNEKLVEGEAIFLLIDINKRRAIRIPNDQYIAYGVELEEDFKIDISKLESLTEEMYSKSFDTRHSDIDSNMHVNNVKYVEWALETVPLDIDNNYDIKELIVVFQKECKYGAKIKSSCEIKEQLKGEIIILHKIENEKGTQLTSLISKWIKRKNKN